MSARLNTVCGLDCNENQGRNRCAKCPGRQQFDLPKSLQPFSTRTLLILLVVMLVALQMVGCGGGSDDPHDGRKNEPSPQCAANPGSCQ